ncbi:MAG TPA: type II toxin-antitoxin system VapC family toxin [Terriglobales bacterium]|nr:type II toxin-antitoxin system VapC family toxin [Terriglobales bacterium]
MRLLLDTAVLIFAAEAPERLSRRATSVLEDPENALEVSAVSLVEIAIKSGAGRLRLSRESVEQAMEDIGARSLSFTAAHAFQMFQMSPRHRDPFDRQIIAQAIVEDVPVITPDSDFRLYKGLRIIW